MALVQPIEARVGLDTGAIPDTSRDQSIARGLGQLGEAIGQVGQVLGEHELRLAEQKRKLEEFRLEQEFLRRGNAIGAEYETMKLNMDPSGEGFAVAANTMVMGQWDEFLKTVPDWLRPRYDELVLTDKDTRLSQAASDEVAQQHRFYETGIADAVSTAQTAVGNNPGHFNQHLAQVIRAIDATNWSTAKKADERRKVEQVLGRAWIGRQLSDDPARAMTLLGVGDGAMAAPEVAMLSPGERVGLYEQAQLAIKQLQTAAAAAEKQEEQRVVAGLREGIRLGMTTTAAVLAAPLADEVRAGLLQNLAGNRNRLTRADEVLASWRSGTAATVAPFDRSRRAEVNDAYERLVVIAPDEAAEVSTDFIKSFGIVPDRVVEKTRQGLASEDLPSVAAGMEQAARLSSLAAATLRDTPDGEVLIDAATAFEHFTLDRAMTRAAAVAAFIRDRDQDQPDTAVLRRRWLEDASNFAATDVDGAFEGHAHAD